MGNPAAEVLLAALAYALCGAPLMAFMASGPAGVAPFWPGAGLAFALVFVRGPRLLPGVMLGSLLLNLFTSQSWASAPPAGLAVPLVSAAAAALQAQLGAHWVRRRLGSRLALARGGEIIEFLLLAGPLSCLLSPLLGVGIRLIAGTPPPSRAVLMGFSWWVGDSIGVIVFAPLFLMLLQGRSDLWRGRRLKVAIPSLLVAALWVAASLRIGALEQRQFQLRLDQSASRAMSALQRNLFSHEEALHGIRSLYEASDYVSRREFERFTRSSLQRLRGLQALSWNPILRPEDLGPFENLQRRREGLPSYRVTEKGSNGALRSVSLRSRHVPVAYIEPLAANRLALGFDIATDPSRSVAMERALQSGRAEATSTIRLVQEPGHQWGVLVLLPVPEPRGFAVGVYRLDDLLEDTFAGAIGEGLDLRLVDRTASASPPVVLARYPRRQNPTAPAPGDPFPSAADAPVVRRPLVHAGRSWVLEVRPTPSFLAVQPARAAPWLLPGGLLISGLLEGFLLLMTGMERQSQRELESKLRTSLTTAAVAHEIKQPLTAMLLQARAIEIACRQEGEAPDREILLAAAEGLTRDARRINLTIEKIRDILGNVVSTLQPIDLAEPARRALLLARGDLRLRGIELRCDGLEEARMIVGDGDQLVLVILNLLRNAIEATGDGGTVSICLRSQDSWVDLEVSDDGPGFPEAPGSLDRLVLTTSKAQGTGVGLYVVHCAMENHHASIRIGRSSLGGALVRLRFPAIVQKPRPPFRKAAAG